MVRIVPQAGCSAPSWSPAPVVHSSDSGSTLDQHVHQRGLQRLQPGVFALAGAHSGPAQRAKAVELAVGQPALVTGWSALHLYGLVRAAPSSVHVLLPHARRSPDLPRVVAHRTSTWAQAGAAKAAGVAVSSPARSIVVVAREAELEVVRGLVIDARQRRLLRLEDLAACVAGLAAAQRAGDVGWRVRRVTWTTYQQHWPELIAQLRRLLLTAGSQAG